MKHKFGHRIVRIDPLGVAGPAETSDGLNPFDFINEQSAGFIDECRSLVELLVTRPGTEPPDPHWNERASDILVAFCAFVCALEADVTRRNLSVVRDLVSSRHTYKEALETMQKIKGFRGVIDRLGFKLTWLEGRELGSVQSTVSRHIGWMDSPGRRRLHIQINVRPLRPMERQDDDLYQPAARQAHNAGARHAALVGHHPTAGGEQRRQRENPVLFLVDEAAHLGKLRRWRTRSRCFADFGIRYGYFFSL